MPSIYRLEMLEVIGCTEVPGLTPAMPRVLSAIFAVRGEDVILFPPYTLDGRNLIHPVQSNRKEFAELVECEEISPFGPVKAMADYELWLDDSGSVLYQDSTTVRKGLNGIFTQYCNSALLALKAANFERARIYARVAYSARPRQLGALKIRAAAESLMLAGHPDVALGQAELALTEGMAASITELCDFRRNYLALVNEIRPPQASKFAGVTKRKPASPMWCNFHSPETACV